VRHRSETTPAILLRSVDYGEADRIVTLLTQRFGKAAYIARSARRSTKRFGAALQPLSLLSVQVAVGRGALGTLERAEITRALPRVLGDLGRMQAGFAGLELARELTPEHEPDPGVFATVAAFLAALDLSERPPAQLLLCLQARLLALVGLSPQLHRCGLCDKPAAPERTGLFDAQLGHLVCSACGGARHRLTGAARVLLMRAAGPEWIAAAEGEPLAAELRAAALAAMGEFVEQRIGRPLKAAELRPLVVIPISASSDRPANGAEDYGRGRVGGLYPQRSGAKRARSED
jgi:DNA repair protein RecO (recombination protein O)